MTTPDRVLFVTGTPRSGTTLVDKLLWQFPEMDSFSQPLPLLLVQRKAAFLEKTQHPQRLAKYPLSDQQFENYYAAENFERFLLEDRVDPEAARLAQNSMANFSGRYHQPDAADTFFHGWHGGTLSQFVLAYFQHFQQKNSAMAAAWKETYAEEFIPWVLASNAKVMLVIRDPRDIATSLNYGANQTYGGKPRPLLWIARQWRKSVAYALAHRHHPSILICRFEDLVRQPQEETLRWRRFLHLEQPWQLDDTLEDQSGMAWQSNSSFERSDRISSQPIGRFAKSMPRGDVRFVEALCHAEMLAMGYSPEIAPQDVLPVLRSQAEEPAPVRPELMEFRWTDRKRQEEIERRSCLVQEHRSFSAPAFIFERSFNLLTRAATHP